MDWNHACHKCAVILRFAKALNPSRFSNASGAQSSASEWLKELVKVFKGGLVCTSFSGQIAFLSNWTSGVHQLHRPSMQSTATTSSNIAMVTANASGTPLGQRRCMASCISTKLFEAGSIEAKVPNTSTNFGEAVADFRYIKQVAFNGHVAK